MDSDDPRLCTFGLMISRPKQKEREIKEKIICLWNGGSGDFNVSFAAIYRLLEYEDVTGKEQDSFVKFIETHWSAWKEKIQQSYPTPQRILAGAQARLNDPDFPEWKKWIYLIEIACSPDSEEAESFLNIFKTNN